MSTKWKLLGSTITLLMMLFGEASAAATSQMVSLTVVSRCGTSVVIKKAELNMEDGHQEVDVPLTRVGLFFYTGSATVAPGRYHVGALVRGATSRSDCWGGTGFTVLPDHDRDIGFEVTNLGSTHYDAHAFLYGTLPFAGFVRGSLMGKFGELPIEVDRNAYYAEHEYPGRYTLRLYFGDSSECRMQVDVPEQGQGRRVDISAQQAQRCLGFSYHYPSTGERGFIPLFPSPSPTPST